MNKGYQEYLHSVVAALGGYQKREKGNPGDDNRGDDNKEGCNLKDGPRALSKDSQAIEGDLVYVEGDECIECLKDLKRMLRNEESDSNQITRFSLARWDTLTKDLIPILELNSSLDNDSIGRVCYELIVYLLTPIKDKPFVNCFYNFLREEQEMRKENKESGKQEDYFSDVDRGSASEGEMELDGGYDLVTEDEESEEEVEIKSSLELNIQEYNEHLIRYKKEILKNPWIIRRSMIKVNQITRQEKVSPEDEHFLFITFTMLKSLLSVPKLNEELFITMKKLLIFDYLIYFSKFLNLAKFQSLFYLYSDLVYSIFKYVDMQHLISSITDNGGIEKKTADKIKQELKEFNIKALNELHLQNTRHSRFGGTNLLLNGSKQKLHVFNLDNNYMNNLLKNNNNSTTDNTIKKDDNKTIFGGKVQSYFTQPKDYIHKIPTGRELASFKFHNVGHVLKLLPITGKDGHNKKYLLKVDSIIVYEVQKDECKTILIDFLYKYCANVANMLFDLSQKKINHNIDDKVKQLILLTNCINLIRQYLIKGEYKLINKSISLINKEGLYHYFINNINEFKAAKQYKVLNFCLNGLQAWIALMYEMSRLDPIKNENENEKLVQVAEHHIHNFIYDYALLKPVHDLYNVYFHPSISSSLIEFTYVMNRMVKAFFKTQTSITAKKKRIRSRKNQGNKKSKLDQLEDDFNQKMNLLNPDELILSYDLENNETQSENKRINGNESESEKNSEEEEYDDRVITFQRYIKNYCNDSIIKSHIIELEIITNSIQPVRFFIKQTYSHSRINSRLRPIVTLFSYILLDPSDYKMFFRISYLHSLYTILELINEMEKEYKLSKVSGTDIDVLEDSIERDNYKRLVGTLPSKLNYFGSLKTFIQSLMDYFMKQLRLDPYLFESITPKSIKNSIKATALDMNNNSYNHDSIAEEKGLNDAYNHTKSNNATIENKVENNTTATETNDEIDPEIAKFINEEINDPNFFDELGF